MLQFHALPVANVARDTTESVSIELAVPQALHDQYRFQAGQFVTVRATIDGEDLRRAYSIHIPPSQYSEQGVLRIGVKRVHRGKFSSWLNTQLQRGDTLDVMPPEGRFVLADVAPTDENHYVGFAGGSGITPILSHLEHILTTQPKNRFTLVYGNRTVTSIMFSERISGLKNRFMQRLQVLHVLSDERQECELLTGLLTVKKCAEVLSVCARHHPISHALVCGPEPMMDAAERALLQSGLAAEHILIERFGVPPTTAGVKAPSIPPVATQTFSLQADGLTRRIPISAQQTVLDAGLAAGLALPYACKAGVCCTCKAKVVSGQAPMRRNFTLTADEIARGFVLTCQADCVGDDLAVSFDER